MKAQGLAVARLVSRPFVLHRFALCAVFACAVAITAQAGGVAKVKIVSPEPDAVVIEQVGNVQVRVATSPEVHLDDGDQLSLWLDGRLHSLGTTGHFELLNVSSGIHELKVQIETWDGSVKAVSVPVNFHMQRRSTLVDGKLN